MLRIQGKELYRAVIRLQHNEDFQTYMEYLQKKLNNYRKENDRQTTVILQWNQGKCQILQELLDLPDVAKKELQ